MGIHRRIRVEAPEARVDVRGTRRRSGPWGLFGGHEGGRFHEAFDPPLTGPWQKFKPVREDQRIGVYTPGAGGYGDPRDRDRALVRRDLEEGRISPQAAREIYGLEE